MDKLRQSQMEGQEAKDLLVEAQNRIKELKAEVDRLKARDFYITYLELAEKLQQAKDIIRKFSHSACGRQEPFKTMIQDFLKFTSK